MRPENVREPGRERGERESEGAEGQRFLIGIGFNKYQPINVIEVLKPVVDSLSFPFQSSVTAADDDQDEPRPLDA